MMFDTSKSGGCTERVNYLKRGFLFYMCASCMLLAQFAIYLVNSNYWESLNFVGGFYYLMAALGQAFLFNLIPWVILHIPFTWWRQMRKVPFCSPVLYFYWTCWPIWTGLFSSCINFISTGLCWIWLLVGEETKYSCLIILWSCMGFLSGYLFCCLL